MMRLGFHCNLLCFTLLFALITIAEGWTPPTTTRTATTSKIRFSSNRQTSSLILSSSPSNDNNTNNASIDPQEYLERAKKLRDEISAFEQKKDQLADDEKQQTQLELNKKQDYIDAYSAVIPILKPDGNVVEEAIFFPPSSTDEDDVVNSEILVLEIPLPMGILLGQEDNVDSNNNNNVIVVDEVAEGTNGEAYGVKEGDILRACTACRMEMSQPTWQLIAGGIGQPKTIRMMYGTDGESLEQVMEAIGSNRMDPQGRPVVLVLERPNTK